MRDYIGNNTSSYAQLVKDRAFNRQFSVVGIVVILTLLAAFWG